MKTRRIGMSLMVCLVAVILLAGLLGACAEPEATPAAPKPSAPAPSAPAPTAPAPSAPAPTAPAPSAPAAPAPSGEGPQYGGVLRQIYGQGPERSIGVPWNMMGPGSERPKQDMIETLLMQTNDGQILPCLAESYEWSSDQKSITFHLRKGVNFHDGTPFNAEAVKWNFEKQIAAKQLGTAEIASMEVVDDYTFRINLTEYLNSWIDNLTASTVSHTGMIISPTAYETNGEEWANWHPVGTGPFKFKHFEEQQYLEAERNDDYWGGKPYLDGIKWLFIGDEVTAQLLMEAGDAEMYMGTRKEVADAMIPKGYLVDTVPGNTIQVLIPSGAKPDSPWSNQKVREAAEYAIDKKKIVETFFGDYAEASYQLCKHDELPYDPDFKGREYDPDKARQLLVEAGYPNGFKTTLYCMTMAYDKKVDAIQAYLDQVGIRVELEVISHGKWIDLETNGWEDGLDYVGLGSGTFRGSIDRHWVTPTEPNWVRGLWWNTLYRPPELETLIQEYYQIYDLNEEKAKGQEIVQLLYDQAVGIPLWFADTVNVMKPTVHLADVPYEKNLSGGLADKGHIEQVWMEK